MNQKGVTLIELIIVMIIIAIGAALMTPGISSWMTHYRLKSATRDIVSIMRTAQMKAISNNLIYEVVFAPPTGSYILRHTTAAGGTPTQEGVPQALSTGIQYNTTFAGNIAQFFPDSRVSAGNLDLTNLKESKRIQLSGRRIRVVE